MAENSRIEWTTHTFNPWRGCQRVAPECDHCYAEAMSKRNPATLGTWGPAGTRVVAAESYWRAPVRWNANAEGAEERPRVFCASLSDVFEDWQGVMVDASGQQLFEFGGWWLTDYDVPLGIELAVAGCPLSMSAVRRRLFRLINSTPNLDWLLLTKRPENVERLTPTYFPGGYVAEAGTMNQEGPRPNVWIGTSAGTQATADRFIPHLLKAPAAVRFLSCEPLLGPVDLGDYLDPGAESGGPAGFQPRPGIDWVIVGGESGPHARPCDVEWIRSIVRQCREAGVPVFVKQLGAPAESNSWAGSLRLPGLSDKKGGDMEEWPEDLRIREVPTHE